MKQQLYFTPREVAEMTGRSRRFITRQVEAGNLRASKVGSRTILISRAALDDWLTAGQLAYA